ncbi:MAG: sodium:solute symporter family protein [Bythopirellula sp.]
MFAAVSMSIPDWLVLIAYFVAIVWVGIWFGKFTRSTDDFFFAGRRFSWWLVAVSCVATLVGSYSFVQYAETGYRFGTCAVLPYTNEWFVLPLFLLGWLPIVYYNRIASIPEYFQRRFDFRTRMLVMVLMLLYLEGYVAINLYTIGQFFYGLFGWNIVVTAALMAVVSGLYLHSGGQTSVLMTDLLQGFLLLAVGLGIFALGLWDLGGWMPFWQSLPETHRLPFAPFNESADLNFVGDYWNDAMVGTFAFYFINQGILMRFLSARSVRDGRKAMLAVVIVMMPLAAVAVSSAGWVGRAMVESGQMTAAGEGFVDVIQDDGEVKTADKQLSQNIFVQVSRRVCQIPGLFGLVVATVVAALMSTLDTLITAVSAVAVNDIWRTMRPDRPDSEYLKAAKYTAIGSATLGAVLLPLFTRFDSIYQALSAFTSTVAPPLVVAIVLGAVWPRFTSRAAFWSVIIGFAALVISHFEPRLVAPVAHGIPGDNGYSYIRALFGLLATLIPALSITFFFPGKASSGHEGLVMHSISEAIQSFKGGDPNYEKIGATRVLQFTVVADEEQTIQLPQKVMQELAIQPGDHLHVSDDRWWLGGFRSLSIPCGGPGSDGNSAMISTGAVERGNLRKDRAVRIEKIL